MFKKTRLFFSLSRTRSLHAISRAPYLNSLSLTPFPEPGGAPRGRPALGLGLAAAAAAATLGETGRRRRARLSEYRAAGPRTPAGTSAARTVSAAAAAASAPSSLPECTARRAGGAGRQERPLTPRAAGLGRGGTGRDGAGREPTRPRPAASPAQPSRLGPGQPPARLPAAPRPVHLDVSMAATNLENQLHSAQKNLLFLQREHAGTLKGLHAEIRRLQQHCTDLTYELTLKGSDQAGAGSSRGSELRQRCEELEAQLRAKEQEKEELAAALEQKNAMIAVLENTVKEREKKYLEELKVKSHKLSLLTGELEQRAGAVAYLTAQLHAAKKKLLGSCGADGGPAGSPALAGYKPAPPKDKLPETPRRRMKKSLSAPLHPELEEVYRFGADSRKLLLREPVEAMPDPTPFLLARESAEVHLIKERPLVIPPIASDRGPSEPHSPGRDKAHKAHVGVAHRIPHAVPPQPPAQVETLAVDQVNAGKVARKHSGTDRTV